MKNAKSHLLCGACILALLLGIVATSSAQAQTYRVLYSFTGAPDGAFPHGTLARYGVGTLAGTTPVGGEFGAGTVFTVTVAGKETVLYSFGGGADGGTPEAGVVLDAAANLYGTTLIGGTTASGTVFEVKATGAETVLHSFTRSPDGSEPFGGLLRAAGGTLYGTTSGGGLNNSGTAFAVTASGTEKILTSFPLGAGPECSLVRDAAGNFYGTTAGGGELGFGAVFKLSMAGKETTLYSFAGGTDGEVPLAGLVIDAAANLYGTTSGGGESGFGTVFKLDPTGAETTLHSFSGGADGDFPVAGLIIDAAGNLYGTTQKGGPAGAGTVFKVDPAGNETVLHAFTGGVAGASPIGLVMDPAGNIYGTTTAGGDPACNGGCGVVFVVKP